MRNRLTTCAVLLLLFVWALPTEAKTLNTLERQVLLKQIELLQAEVMRLQKVLTSTVASQPLTRAVIAAQDIYPSRFYDGDYEALYFVERNDLIRRDSSSVRSGDELVWKQFLSLAGKQFTDDYISEYRIFNDEENLLTGYVEQKADGTWILAVNRFGDNLNTEYNSDFMVELLLHESAHIVFYEDMKYEEDFVAEFWETSEMRRHWRNLNRTENHQTMSVIGDRFYHSHEHMFVSDYAATNPTEDVVESFVTFMLEGRSNGQNIRDQKINFFYQYSELVGWRAQLRQAGII